LLPEKSQSTLPSLETVAGEIPISSVTTAGKAAAGTQDKTKSEKRPAEKEEEEEDEDEDDKWLEQVTDTLTMDDAATS